MIFLQTKAQVKNMNIISYHLYYTVTKIRDGKEILKNNENDYINFDDFVTPNLFIGRKYSKEILK